MSSIDPEKTQYAYSRNEETYHGRCNSIEEAIAESGVDEGDCIFIGEVVPYIPHYSAIHIIDQLQCEAADECGEAGEEWLNDLSKEDIQKLDRMVNGRIKKWLEEIKEWPTFYQIDNARSYVAGEQISEVPTRN